MCTVSAVGDNYRRYWHDAHPGWNPMKPIIPGNGVLPDVQYVTAAEFNALRAELEELKTLLKAAKKFDEATGQPDCEHDDKVAMIKALAKSLCINMDEVFK